MLRGAGAPAQHAAGDGVGQEDAGEGRLPAAGGARSQRQQLAVCAQGSQARTGLLVALLVSGSWQRFLPSLRPPGAGVWPCLSPLTPLPNLEPSSRRALLLGLYQESPFPSSQFLSLSPQGSGRGLVRLRPAALSSSDWRTRDTGDPSPHRSEPQGRGPDDGGSRQARGTRGPRKRA